MSLYVPTLLLWDLNLSAGQSGVYSADLVILMPIERQSRWGPTFSSSPQMWKGSHPFTMDHALYGFVKRDMSRTSSIRMMLYEKWWFTHENHWKPLKTDRVFHSCNDVLPPWKLRSPWPWAPWAEAATAGATASAAWSGQRDIHGHHWGAGKAQVMSWMMLKCVLSSGEGGSK